MARKIKCFGSYNGHQSGNIYDMGGLSPALCCTDYKAPIKILETGGGIWIRRFLKIILVKLTMKDM